MRVFIIALLAAISYAQTELGPNDYWVRSNYPVDQCVAAPHEEEAHVQYRCLDDGTIVMTYFEEVGCKGKSGEFLCTEIGCHPKKSPEHQLEGWRAECIDSGAVMEEHPNWKLHQTGIGEREVHISTLHTFEEIPDGMCSGSECILLRNPRNRNHYKAVRNEVAVGMMYEDYANHWHSANHQIPAHVKHRNIDELHEAVPTVVTEAKRRFLRRRRNLQEEEVSEVDCDNVDYKHGQVPNECSADPLKSGKMPFGVCDGPVIGDFAYELTMAITKMNPTSVIQSIAENIVNKQLGCKITGAACKFQGLFCWVVDWFGGSKGCEVTDKLCEVQATICPNDDVESNVVEAILTRVRDVTATVVCETLAKPINIISQLVDRCAGDTRDVVNDFLGDTLWPHPSWWPGLGLQFQFGVDLFVFSATVSMGFAIGNDWILQPFMFTLEGDLRAISDWKSTFGNWDAIKENWKDALDASMAVGIDVIFSVFGGECLAGWGTGGGFSWEQSFGVPAPPFGINGIAFGVNFGLNCSTWQDAFGNTRAASGLGNPESIFDNLNQPWQLLKKGSQKVFQALKTGGSFASGKCTLCTLSISITAIWDTFGAAKAVKTVSRGLKALIPDYDQASGLCVGITCSGDNNFILDKEEIRNKNEEMTREDITRLRGKVGEGVGLTEEECKAHQGSCKVGQYEIEADGSKLCMTCKSVNCGGEGYLADICEHCPFDKCYSADCEKAGDRCVEKVESLCGIYHGIPSPQDPSKCCPNTCGDTCGAENCVGHCCVENIPDVWCDECKDAPCELADDYGICPMGYDAVSYDVIGEGELWAEPRHDVSRTISDCARICDEREGCTGFEFAVREGTNDAQNEKGMCGTYTGDSGYNRNHGWLNQGNFNNRLAEGAIWRSCKERGVIRISPIARYDCPDVFCVDGSVPITLANECCPSLKNCPKVYYSGVLGSTCATLSELIMTESECSQAVKSLGISDDSSIDGTYDIDYIPGGCSHRPRAGECTHQYCTDGIDQTHFNELATRASLGAGRGDLVPICEITGPYYLGEVGSTCASLPEVITDKRECGFALKDLRVKAPTVAWAGEAEGIPGGCSYRPSADECSHSNCQSAGDQGAFNEKPYIGVGRGDLRPVCKIVPLERLFESLGHNRPCRLYSDLTNSNGFERIDYGVTRDECLQRCADDIACAAVESASDINGGRCEIWYNTPKREYVTTNPGYECILKTRRKVDSLGPDSVCRVNSASDAHGYNRILDGLDREGCLQQCEIDAQCTAFEFYSNSGGSRCEIYYNTPKREYTQLVDGFECVLMTKFLADPNSAEKSLGEGILADETLLAGTSARFVHPIIGAFAIIGGFAIAKQVHSFVTASSKYEQIEENQI